MEGLVFDLRRKHEQELENLKLVTRPLTTLKYFILAVLRYLIRFLAKGGSLLFITGLVAALAYAIAPNDGPINHQAQELLHYVQFGLWWLALGIASSIGLASGMHTFVLYLAPHIALFTLKTMECGRVDIKSAPYDTMLLKTSPSWRDKNCSEYGPPLFPSSGVPLSSIFPQVQIETILWGIGTAVGELPPFLMSRAAWASGEKFLPEEGNGVLATLAIGIISWFRSHSQSLNFFTILVLSSVPNPLFDASSIMSGQLGMPVWKFFLATAIGKALIKAQVQAAFVISVCNNQLLDFIENHLITVFSTTSQLGSVLNDLIAQIHSFKAGFLHASPPVSSNDKDHYELSLASLWNTVIWLMLLKFIVQIVEATAKNYLKEKQDKELAASKI